MFEISTNSVSKSEVNKWRQDVENRQVFYISKKDGEFCVGSICAIAQLATQVTGNGGEKVSKAQC